jgi:hypothetical protein
MLTYWRRFWLKGSKEREVEVEVEINQLESVEKNKFRKEVENKINLIIIHH